MNFIKYFITDSVYRESEYYILYHFLIGIIIVNVKK